MKDQMREALQNLLNRYTSLFAYGDCGYWYAEQEQVVKDARAALAAQTQQNNINSELLKVAESALEWIDGVPSDTPLPTMSGFDRDWADKVIADANEIIAAQAEKQKILIGAVTEVLSVLESDNKAIVDTVWTTKNNNETLWEHCSHALEQATRIEYKPAIQLNLELQTQARQESKINSDYTVLIARLAYALKKADPENSLSLKAAEFLKRKGHTFNPLRDESQEQQPAQDQQEPYGWRIKGMEKTGMPNFFTMYKLDAIYWRDQGMTLVPIYL